MRKNIVIFTNGIIDIYESRKKHDLTNLFDIKIVTNFTKFMDQAPEPKTLKSKYISMFIDLTSNIVTTIYLYEKISKTKSVPISDSLPSVSRLLTILDAGFSIFSDILRRDYSLEEKREIFFKAENIFKTFDILTNRRLALFRYIDPFTSVYVESEIFDEAFKDGVELLKATGYLDEKIETKYRADIVDKQKKMNRFLTRQEVKDLVIKLLNEEGQIIKMDFLDKVEALLKHINTLIPEAKCKLMETKYTDGQEIVNYKIALFKTTIDLSIKFGKGLREITELLNPIIGKNTGKVFVSASSYQEVILILSDKTNEVKIKASKLLSEIPYSLNN